MRRKYTQHLLMIPITYMISYFNFFLLTQFNLSSKGTPAHPINAAIFSSQDLNKSLKLRQLHGTIA